MKVSSKIILVITVLGALGGWFIGFKAYADMMSPQAIGGLFMIMSSTIGAALGVDTVKPGTITTSTSTSTTVPPSTPTTPPTPPII